MAADRKRKTTGIERERKFLVGQLPPNRSQYPHHLIEQGYLAIARENNGQTEIRIRRLGKHHLLTVKRGHGEKRLETEVPMPANSAKALWPITQGRRISKVRYKIPHQHLHIELDVYRGNAQGLAVAEVEFKTLAAARRFSPPDWFGPEITGHKKYSNSHLAITGWKRKRQS